MRERQCFFVVGGGDRGRRVPPPHFSAQVFAILCRYSRLVGLGCFPHVSVKHLEFGRRTDQKQTRGGVVCGCDRLGMSIVYPQTRRSLLIVGALFYC